MYNFDSATNFAQIDRRRDLGQTQNYNVRQFQRKPLILTGIISDQGIDTNGNGKFDRFRVSVEVDVLIAGSYQWNMKLSDQNLQTIDLANGQGFLTAGFNQITVEFNDSTIGRSSKNGPFEINDLLLFGPKSIVVTEVGRTRPYRSLQFENGTADDTVAPVSTATLSPSPNNNGWANEDVLVSLNSVDNTGGSGVKEINYSATGAQTISNKTVNVDSTSFPLVYEGTTTVTYFAKDNLDNTEATKTIVVKIDKTAPVTSASSVVQNAQQASVTLTATDALSGVSNITYSIDGSAAKTYAGSFLVSGAGDHTVTYYAKDVAGNIEPAKTLNIKLEALNLSVQPTLECVVDNLDGTFTARFGYLNNNSAIVMIPVGDNNQFSPAPKDRGQVVQFQPGRVVSVFSVPFNGSKLVWTLKGPDNKRRTATASRGTVRCQ